MLSKVRRVEELLAQFVPQVFLGVQLGRIGRQEQQAQIDGQFEGAAVVPARAVDDHHEVLGGVAARHFGTEPSACTRR